MKKYIKPSADVVELAFSNNIAAITRSGSVYDGLGIGGGSLDSGVGLFEDVNGLSTSGKNDVIPSSEEEESGN